MKTLVIAEVGVNHNGSVELAKELIDAAVYAGADIVKFQTFKADKIVSKDAPKAMYQQNEIGGETQYSMLKRLELTNQEHFLLKRYCEAKNIRFLSTAFDFASIDFLHNMGLALWKIPSGEVTDYPYLRKIAKFGEPIIMSTGMCSLDEISYAINVLISNGASIDKLTVLHCNTDYPTPMKDVNLKAMLEIKDQFSVKVGYSDHTLGLEIPIAAVALGASVIEKHFTLSRGLTGPDHKASLEPDEFRQMVIAIRNVEVDLESGHKIVSDSEKRNINVVRKNIVAASYIRKGDVFSEANITVKRSGGGISPIRWNEIIGKVANRDFKPDDAIEL